MSSDGRNRNRTIRVWNENHPDDLMPQKGYLIHHKDEDPSNDDPGNLEKITRKEHNNIHKRVGWHHSKVTKLKMRKNKVGSINPAKRKEVRKKISKANKGKVPWNLGKKHSKKTIKKMSEKKTGSKNPNWKGGISYGI